MNISNIADIIVILILFAGLLWGVKSGLVQMLTRVVYSVASFGASLLLYPVIAKFIRNTPIFTLLKEKLITTLGLETAINSYTKQQEVGVINSLNLPDMLKSKLLENNNSVIYDLVNADSLVDYIAGFMANMIINLVLVWLLFAIFLILLKIILSGIELIAKLPVINGVNKIGGAIAGVVLSTIIIWICFAVVYIFIAEPAIYNLYSYIESSTLASTLYNNNVLLELILERLFR